MIEIEAPDGTVVEFPDGTPDDVITSAMRKSYGGPEQQGNASRVTGPQLGTNMMTFGLSDALGNLGIAGIEAAMGKMGIGGRKDVGFMDNWNKISAQREADRKAYREQNPGSALVHELGGGIVGGGGASRALGAGVKAALPQVAQRASQLNKGGAALRTIGTGAEGAALGAAAASAGDQDPVTGALMGGGISAAAVPVVSALKAGGRAIGGGLGLGNTGRARREVERVMANSGKTPQQLADEMLEAQRLGKQDFTLTDALGRPGAMALRGTSMQPSKAGYAAEDFLDARVAQQAGRVEDDVVNAFGSPDTARQARMLQEAQRRTQGRQNYNAAKVAAQDVDVADPVNYLRSQVADDAAKDTAIQAKARELLSRLDKSDGTGVAKLNMDFQDLLAFKKELDDAADVAYRAGRGNEGELLKGLRNSIDDQLAKASAPYANARNTYREQSRGIEAIDKGLKAENMLGRDRVDVFNALKSDAERASYLTGRANKALEKAGRSTGGQNTANRLLTRNNRVEYPAVAGERGRDFLRKMELEDQMAKTRNIASLGSRSDKNIAAGVDAGGAISDALMGNAPGLISRGIRGAVNAATGKNEAVRTKIIEALMSRAPDQAIRIAQEAERAGRLSRGSTRAIAVALGIGGSVGFQ